MALLDALFEMAGYLLMALLAPLLGYGGGKFEGGAPVGCGEESS